MHMHKSRLAACTCLWSRFSGSGDVRVRFGYGKYIIYSYIYICQQRTRAAYTTCLS